MPPALMASTSEASTGDEPEPPPPPPPDAGAEEGEDSEPEYTVEKIIRHKGLASNRLYFVKWAGDEDEDEKTWEPASNLHPDLVKEYEQTAGAASSSGGGGKPRKRPRGTAPKDEHGMDKMWDEEVGCQRAPARTHPRAPHAHGRAPLPLGSHLAPRLRG